MGPEDRFITGGMKGDEQKYTEANFYRDRNQTSLATFFFPPTVDFLVQKHISTSSMVFTIICQFLLRSGGGVHFKLKQ